MAWNRREWIRGVGASGVGVGLGGLPAMVFAQKTLSVGSIFNGIHFKTKFETVPGTTATAERNLADSYTVEVSVKVTVPKPPTRSRLTA